MRFIYAALATGLVGFSYAAQAQQITGAGSTFAGAHVRQMGRGREGRHRPRAELPGHRLGRRHNQINNRTVDFGASDMPVDAAKLAKHQPAAVPDRDGRRGADRQRARRRNANKLKLTGELLADIYAGKITKWNDPKLVEANHGVTLPNLAIAPVHRADGSGTTFVFTYYLSAVSARTGRRRSAPTPA